jgi:hypothetical protein
MSKSGQQPSKADVGGQRAPEGPASGQTPATGQKVSLERGRATHKKNPGKRAKAGGS